MLNFPSEEAAMSAKRNSWSVGGRLCCLCVVLASLALAGPLQAQTFTVFPADTIALAINDSAAVVGAETSIGFGFLRTPDGTFISFRAAENAVTTPKSINNT